MKTKLLLLLLLPVFCCAQAEAQDFEVDGIWYHLTSNVDVYHVEVTSPKSGQPYSGDIVIPDSVTYYGTESTSIPYGQACVVDGIGMNAFRNSSITSVSLPKTIRSLSWSCFDRCNNLKELILPEGVVSSPPRIANECELLEKISIPSTLTDWGKSSSQKSSAFLNCKNLKTVVVSPDNPVYDSRNNCNAIIETATNTLLSASAGTPNIPEGVVSIGQNAFTTCTFDSIYIPETVKFIGEGHRGNTFLANITANRVYAKDLETWCNIETENKFSYFTSYESTTTAVGFEELYLDGKLITNVTFPSSVRVARNFARYRHLTSVVIPSTIEEIDDYAFAECEHLGYITIEDGVKRIGDGAFYRCHGLYLFPTIPSTVEFIGDKAFKRCGLGAVGSTPVSIVLPAALKQMGSEVFAECDNLKLIGIKAVQPPVIPDDAFTEEQYKNMPIVVPYGMKTAYEQADGWKQFKNIIDDVEDIDNYKTMFLVDGLAYQIISPQNKEVELISRRELDGTTTDYPDSLVIPATVTDAGMTYKVTRIRSAIEYSHSSITIPPTIKVIHGDISKYSVCNIHIEDLAAWCNISFYNTISGELRVEGYSNSILDYMRIKNNLNLYLNGQLVTDLQIPDGITSISDAAFAGFRGIKTVHIPASVKRIGARAFKGSTLESLTIPATLDSWGVAAFADCESLKSLTIEEGVTGIGPGAFANCSELEKVSIPQSVKQIGNFAFYGCQSLKDMSLKQSLERIGEWAFAECRSLKEVDIPASVKSIGRNAFTACKALNKVSLKEGLEQIDRYAFNRCTSLQSLHIPASVNYIGRNVVEDCNNMKTLSVADGNAHYDTRNQCNAIMETASNTLVAATPEAVIRQDVEVMGDYAFAYCSDRQSITLPEGLKRIGKDAFLHCWSLHTITIPESVDSIGPDAFNRCDGLKEVIVKNAEPCSIDEWAFFINTYFTATLVVPDNAIEKYRKACGWQHFSHIEGITDYMKTNIEPIIDRNVSEVQFTVDDGRILLSNLRDSECIKVYTIDGRLLKSVKAAPDGKAILVLPVEKTYVVRTEAKAMKIRL